ncbi:uncharacterized protein CTRU02_203979 [Colletotrichum truncatum]|uniref:Uncharacterized protein n=1 Tax=Colletotrichum truncatum TaxID=5467 RepID=A0ACC3ZAT8_COLTU|nr:uncharacterized protein CTRU02_15462 [Colletotrichum truncatum]KAF6781061.1 hypothetical protein CTRU02_15462 [Colletotrichum truncatum]
MKKRKKRACQTSIDTHPDSAPEGKTTIGDEIITALYTANRKSVKTAFLTEGARATRVLHSRASRISFINQGGICGSFREPREGRIL